MAKENRKYKDSVFTDLFYADRDAKVNLLSLYNALYGTEYTDPNLIQKVRLEDVIFKNFKNDIAFMVNNRRIIMGEHQSTINYNMPLRNLMYFGREMEKAVPAKDRYKRNLIKIPTPDFITFYIGKEEYPLEQILRLSDAFVEQTEVPSLELKTRVININYDKKHKILEDCRILGDYSQFIEIAREQENDKTGLEKAVKTCISKGILKDYLERKSSEVINMLMVEYDYDTDIRIQREEALEEGMKEGMKEGIKQGMKQGMERGIKQEMRKGIAALISALQDIGKTKSETRECLKKKYSLSDEDADSYMDEFWV
ncbi:MAG: hypothetical protein SO401_01730 [Blautia sp.]|nr:hypothetical protein [Blautia sp.]